MPIKKKIGRMNSIIAQFEMRFVESHGVSSFDLVVVIVIVVVSVLGA